MSDLLPELIVAVVIFALGALSREIHRRLWPVLSRVRRRRQLRQRPTASEIRTWLVSYYEADNRRPQLATYEEDGSIESLPLLFEESWRRFRFVNASRLSASSVPVDARVLRWKGKYITLKNPDGSEWNDPLVVAARIQAGPPDDRRVALSVAMATYYQYLSRCGALERETYRAIQARRRAATHRSPLRNSTLASREHVYDMALGAQAVGYCVALVFETESGPQVLLQRRSSTVTTYPDCLAVAPVYGCQPVAEGSHMRFEPKFDLLREYFEELFNNDVAARPLLRRSLSWLSHQGPVSTLLELEASGEATFQELGFGVDALNGEIDIAAVLYFSTSAFAEEILPALELNWEYNHFTTVGLLNHEQHGVSPARDFHPGSALTLVLAREWYRARHSREAGTAAGPT
jgi:hypothetical protein